MPDAKLGPKMQEWQVKHSNLYLKSDGKEGHVMKRTPPGGYPEMDVYSLMLTTTGRKSGEKFVFPLYYCTTGDSYIIDPRGEIIAGPAEGETILIAEGSMEVVLAAKAVSDIGGHYSRPDLLRLIVDRNPAERVVDCGIAGRVRPDMWE